MASKRHSQEHGRMSRSGLEVEGVAVDTVPPESQPVGADGCVFEESIYVALYPGNRIEVFLFRGQEVLIDNFQVRWGK